MVPHLSALELTASSLFTSVAGDHLGDMRIRQDLLQQRWTTNLALREKSVKTLTINIYPNLANGSK